MESKEIHPPVWKAMDPENEKFLTSRDSPHPTKTDPPNYPFKKKLIRSCFLESRISFCGLGRKISRRKDFCAFKFETFQFKKSRKGFLKSLITFLKVYRLIFIFFKEKWKFYHFINFNGVLKLYYCFWFWICKTDIFKDHMSYILCIDASSILQSNRS